MHFVLFEDLYGENNAIHFNNILYFLKLEGFQLSEKDRENKSIVIVPKKGVLGILSKVLRKNKTIIHYTVQKSFPKKLYSWISQKVLSKMETPPNKLGHEIKLELNNKFFREDILKLQKLIDKDLSAWLT